MNQIKHAFFSFFLLLVVSNASAQYSNMSLEYVNPIRWGDPDTQMVLDDNYVYCLYNYAFTVLDVSTPSSPEMLFTHPLWGVLVDIKMRDHLVYVLDRDGMLTIFDVQDPTSPLLVNTVQLQQLDWCMDFELYDDYLYVIDLDGGLNLYSLGSEVAPEPLSIKEVLYGVDIVVDSDKLYLTCLTHIYTFDLTNPEDPEELGRIEVELSDISRAAIVEGYLYVSHFYVDGEGTAGYSLKVFDISTPSSPSLINAVNGLGYINQFEKIGNRLYCASIQNGIQVLDISTPSAPVVLGHTTDFENCLGLAVQDTHLCSYDGNTGFSIWETSNSETLTEIGYYETATDMRFLDASNGYVVVETKGGHDYYQGETSYAVRLLNIHHPEAMLGSVIFESASRTNGVLDEEGYGYFLTNNLLKIFRHVSLDEIIEVSSTVVEGDFNQVDLDNDMLMLSNSNGFKLYSISDPENPELVGSYFDNDFEYLYRALDGQSVYRVNGQTLQVIGIALPESPTVITTMDLETEEWPFAFIRFDVSGGIFAADNTTQLALYEFSAPANPVNFLTDEGFHPLGARFTNEIALHNDRLFAATSKGLAVYSFEDQDHLIPTGYAMPGSYSDLDIESEYTYCVGNSTKILVYDHTSALDVPERDHDVPSTFVVLHNYPNPFNATTTLTCAIPQSGIVQLSVTNLLGQTLISREYGYWDAGQHRISLDMRNYPSGNYFVHINSGKAATTRRITLVR